MTALDWAEENNHTAVITLLKQHIDKNNNKLNNNNTTLKPLFPANSLKQIPVANKPLCQDEEIKYLSTTQFKEIFGCEYTETMWGTEEEATYYQKLWQQAINNKNKLTEIELQILDRLENPLNDVAICFINEEVGYGLFAQRDIPKGTVLAIYSGTLDRAKTYNEAHDDYAYALSKNISNLKNILVVSAKEKGGIARFMQHLPIDHQRYKAEMVKKLMDPDFFAETNNISTERAKQLFKENKVNEEFMSEFADKLIRETTTDHEYPDIEFTPETIEYDVATSNTKVKQIVCCGCPMAVIIAEYPIKAGEQIGFSYGIQYWRSCKRYPELFQHNGTVLDHRFYKRTKVNLIFSDPSKKYHELPLEGTTATFIGDVKRNKPITAVINPTEEIPLSVYDLREKLITANAVGKRFGTLALTSFALALKNKLAANFPGVAVKAYYQDPTKSTSTLDGHTVDVVCQAQSQQKFSELTQFFKPIETRVKTFPETNEIVITSTNVVDRQIECFQHCLKT